MKAKVFNLLVLVTLVLFEINNYSKKDLDRSDLVQFVTCLQKSKILDAIVNDENIFMTFNDSIVSGIENRTFANSKGKKIYLITSSHIFIYNIKEYIELAYLERNDSLFFARVKHVKYYGDRRSIKEIIISGGCNSLSAK